MAPEGAAGFRGAAALEVPLPAGAAGALPVAFGPETMGLEGVTVCGGAVVELGALGKFGVLGGGEEEQATKNTATAAVGNLNRSQNGLNRSVMVCLVNDSLLSGRCAVWRTHAKVYKGIIHDSERAV